MTTVEEMRRLAPSEHTYKNLCELIDDCMVEPIGMSVYDMHLADYQYLLHRLRIVTYGVDYKYESNGYRRRTCRNDGSHFLSTIWK